MKEYNLCWRCAHALEDSGKKLTQVHHGKDQKIKCDVCGRKGYGAAYTIEKKKK